MPDDKPFFVAQNRSFAPIEAKDELLHPERNALVHSDSATETQYFGFNVPAERIHGLAYLWHHPNLHVVTGGIMAWRGIKRTALHAELFDMRAFMSDSVLKNDLHEFRLDNGYGVTMLEPLQRFHLTYADRARRNVVDLMYEAVAPAVMFGDGNHFEQTMTVTGELVLRGKTYEIDCFNVRDRSWGKPRHEDIMPLPVVSWMTGVFSKDLSFNCLMFDQASGNPELTGQFALPDAKALNAGWLYRDGKLGRIVQGKKRVGRASESCVPISMELQVKDEFERSMDLRASLVASCPWQVWPNGITVVNLLHWECDGLVGYGDCQEVLWNDYVNHIMSR